MLFRKDCDDLSTYDYENDDYHQYNHSIDHNGFDDSSFINSIMTTIGIAMLVYQNISSFFRITAVFQKPATQIHPLKLRLKAPEDAPFEQQAECQEVVCEACKGAKGQSLPWKVGKGYRKNGPPKKCPTTVQRLVGVEKPHLCFWVLFWGLEMNTLKV